MTSRDFVYWLQGYFEVSGVKSVGEVETQQIRNHLNLVFKHEIDPSIDGGDPKKQQELQEVHDGVQGKPTIPSPFDQMHPFPGTQYRC